MTIIRDNLRLAVVTSCHFIFAIAFFLIWIQVLALIGNPQADFTNSFTGWSMIRAGDGHLLYDIATQTRYQQAILGNGLQFADGLLPFVSPPHLAWSGVWLSSWNLRTAYTIWGIINTGIVVLIGRYLWQTTRDWGWSNIKRVAVITALLGFYPLFPGLVLGTFAPLSLLAMLYMFDNDQKQKPAVAALWLVLATIRFQYILLIGVWLLATRRWRLIGWAAMYMAILAVITSFILGWQIWGDYLRFTQFHSQSFDHFGIYPRESYTLKGTLSIWFGAAHIGIINTLTMSLLVLAAVFLVWRFHRNPAITSEHAGLQYGLTLIINLLLSLHLNLHDVLLLIIPALYTARYVERYGTMKRWFEAFLLSAPMLFYFTHTVIGKRFGIQIPVIWMVILLLMMLYLEQRASTRREQVYE